MTCHHPVGGRWTESPGASLGQPGPGQRHARHHGVSLCGHPRPTRSRTVGRGNDPAGVGLCAVAAVPGSRAHGAGASGGDTEAWRTPRMGLWWCAALPSSSAGAAGGQPLDVWGRNGNNNRHGLLGPALPSHVWSFAASLGAAGTFF